VKPLANNFLLLGCGRWQQDTLIRLVESPLVNKILVIDPINRPMLSEKITHGNCDLNSYSEILSLAISHATRFIVCDTSEYGMKTAARLREDLDAPGLQTEQTHIFINKLKMRDLSKDLVSQNFFYTKISNKNDLEKIPFSTGQQFVLKPTESYASKGVWGFSTLEEGTYFLEKNISSGFTENLVESYMNGREFTVESLISKGEILPLAISTKTRFKDNFSVATSLLYESTSNFNVSEKLMELNSKFISRSGITDGVTHGEYILGLDGTVGLVEIAARGGGTGIYSKMLKRLSGRDVVGHYLNSVSGLNFEYQIDEPSWQYAILGFVFFPIGVLEEVNFDQIKFSWLLDLGLNVKIGEMLPMPNNDNERHGYFWVLGNSLSEIKENILQLTLTMSGRVSGQSITPTLMFDLNDLVEPSNIVFNPATSG
jgi:hypothetical protein